MKESCEKFGNPAAEVTSDNRNLIGIRASRLIPGLVRRFWVPTAIVPFLSTPSSSSPLLAAYLSLVFHPSRIFEQTRCIPGKLVALLRSGRLSGFKRYPLRKLARWRTNQLLIKPLSFRDGRYGDRGDAVNQHALVCCRHKENRITLESRYLEIVSKQERNRLLAITCHHDDNKTIFRSLELQILQSLIREVFIFGSSYFSIKVFFKFRFFRFLNLPIFTCIC